MAKRKGKGKGKKKARTPKGTPAQQAKVERVMGEFKAGTLKSSAGYTVRDRAQAIAIALSEAGLSRPEPKNLGRPKKRKGKGKRRTK